MKENILPASGKIAKSDVSGYVSKFVDAPARFDDGRTNAHGKAVVLAIKDYLAKSYRVLVGLKAFSSAYDEMPDLASEGGPFAGVGDDRAYRRLGGALRAMCSSLAKQRGFFVVLKNKVKKNEIDARWRSVFGYEVSQATKRLDKILSTTREDVAMTPFVLYLEWLDRNGETLESHLGRAVDSVDPSLAYGEYYEGCREAVMEAVVGAMRECAADPALLAKAKAEAETHLAADRARADRRAAEKAERAADEIRARREQARETLWARLRDVEKAYVSSRGVASLARTYGRRGIFYVVGAIRIASGSAARDDEVRYLAPRRAPGKPFSSTADVRKAVKFAAEEEAAAAAAEYLAARPCDVAEVAQVDLGRYAVDFELAACAARP